MKIIIEGAGEVGSHLAKLLRAESNEVTVVDNDDSRLRHLSAYADVETVLGNPSSIKVLKQCGVSKADLFIAVYPFATQEVNIVGALLAKQLGAKKVVARINDEDYLNPENKLLFKEMGIELMFYPEKIAADEIVSSIKHAGNTDSMDFARGKLQVAVFKVNDDSPLIDLTLREFTSELEDGELEKFRIIAVSRGENAFIPDLDTKFMYGDTVYTISKREGLASLTKHFGATDMSVDRVMIMGGGSIAEMVAKALSPQVKDIKIIEQSKARCIELTEKLPTNVLVVNGDGRNSDFLFEESLSEFDAFVSLTGNDEANVLACVVAKKLGISKTIAKVENNDYVHLAEEMGVDTVINKKLLTAGRIFKFTLSGTARFVKYMSSTNAEVIEYTVAPNSAITKSELKDLKFPKNAIIGGVIRGNDSFIAVGSSRIEPYDRVAVFAIQESIKEVDKFFK